MTQQSHSGRTSRKDENSKCTPMFTSALFTIAKTQEQPNCPLTDEWVKMRYALIYTRNITPS